MNSIGNNATPPTPAIAPGAEQIDAMRAAERLAARFPGHGGNATGVGADPRVTAIVPAFDAPFFQAGLAGYSDAAMRLVARRQGCPFCVTEALLDRTLLAGGRGFAKADLGELHENVPGGPDDHPLACQIMGSLPSEMAAAALKAAEQGRRGDRFYRELAYARLTREERDEVESVHLRVPGPGAGLGGQIGRVRTDYTEEFDASEGLGDCGSEGDSDSDDQGESSCDAGAEAMGVLENPLPEGGGGGRGWASLCSSEDPNDPCGVDAADRLSTATANGDALKAPSQRNGVGGGRRLGRTNGSSSLSFEVIDVNLACPVKKVKTKARGGHWLAEPQGAIDILEAVREAVPASIPCTVKLRRSYDDTPEMAANFERIFDAAMQMGYAWATVHARTVEQKYVGPSRWTFLRDLVRRHPNAIVFGSGDIWEVGDIFRMIEYTGVAGVSVARGCIGNPWIFRQARQMLRGAPPTPPTLGEQRSVLEDHYRLLLRVAWGGRRAAVQEMPPPGHKVQTIVGKQMRKFGIRFAMHHPRSEDVRLAFIRVSSIDDWMRVLDEHYPA